VVSSTFVTTSGSSAPAPWPVAAIWDPCEDHRPDRGGHPVAAVSARARRGGEVLGLTDRDLPIGIVGGSSAVMLIPIALLLWGFTVGNALAGSMAGTIAVSLVYVVVTAR